MNTVALGPHGIDSGDTAWMMVATALVLMMTPALGLFYAGLVRSKNTLNTFMMCAAAIAVAMVTWALVGYSLAFDGGGSLLGGLGNAALDGVTFAPRAGTHIPQLLFMAFEATFCIITVALVSGAVVGILFIGFFAEAAWNGVADGLLYGNAAQLGHQALAVLVTPAYAFAMTFLLLRLIGLFTPLRASEHQEAIGMDVTQHGEEAYVTGEGAILITPEAALEGERPLADPV